MIPVILSGGTGSRLWPVSRREYPKQFQALVGDRSMFLQTLERLPKEGVEAPVVVANLEHRFIVAEQLAMAGIQPRRILLEPFGRNTAPAVALAALEILASGRDALMLVLPADHLIDDVERFHAALAQARLGAEQGRLVMFGIRPERPETGYGYIQAGDPVEGWPTADLRMVNRFVEKPDLVSAERFLKDGNYYWNSGMFLFSAQTYLDELARWDPDMLDVCKLAHEGRTEDMGFLHVPAEVFAHCPDNSIDYAVMEKTQASALVPLDARWSDVGSWSSLWDVLGKDDDGNVMIGDVCQQNSNRCFVRSDGRLVTLVGVEDLVVVDTKDAVMVSHRDKVQDVKRLVGHLDGEARSEIINHREVYRPWGSYDSIDLGSRFQVKHIAVKPGASLSLQKHHHRAEHWVVVKGTAEVTCDDRVFLLTENQSTYIPVGSVHRLANPGKIPLEIIEVQSGSYLGEDDIERFEDSYGRAADVETENTVQPEATVSQ